MDDDLPPWAPPSGSPDQRQPGPPGPARPPADVVPPHPPAPSMIPVPPSPGRADPGAATAAALGFGLLAGLALPPLLFWPVFTIVRAIGLPDLLAVLVPLGVAFAVPIALLVQIRGMLRRSTPRHDRAASVLTTTTAVALALWMLVTVLGAVVILVLRSVA